MGKNNIYYHEDGDDSISIDKIDWLYYITIEDEARNKVAVPVTARVLQEMADSLRSFVKGWES